KLSWPLRPLYRRALPAAAALLFMALIPAALGPAFFRQAPPDSRLALPAMEEEGSFLVRAEEVETVLPEELAAFLFAHDQELAERAAEALRTGDMEALTGLLRAGGAQTAQSPSWSLPAADAE